MCDAIEMQHGLVQEEVPAPESHFQAPMGAGWCRCMRLCSQRETS
jgi:hypothetical protein